MSGHSTLGQTFPLLPEPGLCERGTDVTSGLLSCTHPRALEASGDRDLSKSRHSSLSTMTDGPSRNIKEGPYTAPAQTFLLFFLLLVLKFLLSQKGNLGADFWP